MNRMAWLALALTIIVGASIVLLFSIRKQAREAQVVGSWTWGRRKATFEASGHFIAVEPGAGARNNLEGGWEYQGKKVHFWSTVVDGPNPGWVYELSPDGKTMEQVSGNDTDDADVMTKDAVQQ